MAFPVRWLLFALPVATVAVVALALVTGGAVRPYAVARVWGGPTDARQVSVRVEALRVLVERAAVVETPITEGSVVVELHAAGFDARRAVLLDVEGSGEASFELPGVLDGLELTVSQGGELARGRLSLTAERWAKAARRRGGWAVARAGELEVRLAPARGALAVPFEDEVLVSVRRGDVNVPGATLRARGSGLRVRPEVVTTDARGAARIRVEPSEHVASLTLELEAGSTHETATFSLPIVPGALDARREGGSLRITSPVPRDTAYYAFVTEHARLLGGRAVLAPSPNAGGAVAEIPFPTLDPAPRYVVVSSERDLRSPAAVGWPLDAAGDEPLTTFDAVDALLVDGRPRAALRESRRAARVRWVVAAFCAVSLALELLLLVAFTKRSDASLDRHLEGAGVSAEDALRVAPKRSPRVVLALVAIALGFFVVAAAGVLMAR
jgi:hypothetical protein